MNLFLWVSVPRLEVHSIGSGFKLPVNECVVPLSGAALVAVLVEVQLSESHRRIHSLRVQVPLR